MNIGAINVLLMIVGLLLAIFVHEAGHFFVAKTAGVRIFEFSIGLGPKILKKTKKDIQYSFRLFPLGGYVLIASKLLVKELQKTGEAKYMNVRKDQLLENQKWWVKIVFFLAGIAFNFIFAIFLALFIDFLVYGRWVFDILMKRSAEGVIRLFEEIFTGKLFIKGESKVSSIVGATVAAAESQVTIRWFLFYYLNLAVIMFNVLPIPPLDGYRVLEILFTNFIYKKEIGEKTRLGINIGGITFIGIMFVLLLISDVIKLA